MSLVSSRTFPRHSHDLFGLRVVRAGGHASWSGRGPGEAGPDDVIAVSLEEMHDGAPIGRARAWDIIYVEPEIVERLAGPEAARREIGFAAFRSLNLAVRADAALRALASVEAVEALMGR